MINAPDASCAIEFFESAVRAEENIGSQPLEDHAIIEEDLKNARAGVDAMLDAIAILDSLKDFCKAEYDKAQAEIEKDGYSFELSHRTDIMDEVLKKIAELDKFPREPAPPLFLD